MFESYVDRDSFSFPPCGQRLGRVDATRVLKAFGRCLESMGEGTVSWRPRELGSYPRGPDIWGGYLPYLSNQLENPHQDCHKDRGESSHPFCLSTQFPPSVFGELEQLTVYSPIKRNIYWIVPYIYHCYFWLPQGMLGYTRVPPSYCLWFWMDG